MELKSLIMGIFISVAVFAIKSGAGMHYYLVSEREKGWLRKTGFLIICGFAYATIFLTAFIIVTQVDMAVFYSRAALVLKSGMMIHAAMAALMIVWGMILLKRDQEQTKKTGGWLIMVFPCPLCGFVIIFTTSILAVVYPESISLAASLLFLGFIGIKLLTISVLGITFTRFSMKPESFLGWFMLGTAAYFILTIIIIPQFGGMDKIYRLACSDGKEYSKSEIWEFFILFIILSCSVVAGYKTFTSKRRFTQWILGLY